MLLLILREWHYRLRYWIKNGKVRDPYLDWGDSESGIVVVDQNGTRFDFPRMDWREGSDYGLIQFSLREQEVLGNLTVKVNLDEINGVKGNWKLDIPIDLTKSNALTTIVLLHEVQTSAHGVSVHMKKMQYSPSSNELMYETGFTAEEEIRVEKEILQLEAQFGKDNIRPENVFTEFDTAIQYHIENEDQQTIYTHDYNILFHGGRADRENGTLPGDRSKEREARSNVVESIIHPTTRR